jgi:hypothetical protein
VRLITDKHVEVVLPGVHEAVEILEEVLYSHGAAAD